MTRCAAPSLLTSLPPTHPLACLLQELDRGGVDAQIAFNHLGGYPAVLACFTPETYPQAAAALLAAGHCHLHRPSSAAAICCSSFAGSQAIGSGRSVVARGG